MKLCTSINTKKGQHISGQDNIFGGLWLTLTILLNICRNFVGVMIIYSIETFIPKLKEMWKLCFGDSDEFIQFYFDEIYRDDNTLVLVSTDGSPVASLQILPYQIKMGNRIYNAGYLSGIMTHPEHRRKGYMDKLLQIAFDEMMKKGYDYTFLIPQKKEWIDMYAKYGFRLCEPSSLSPENKVLKTPEQWAQIRQNFFDENGIWLEKEPIFPNERKGMIKRLNPSVEDIIQLYLGMMLD